MRKVQQERYTYVPLGPGEDIRVLILEPGRPADPSRGQEADPIRCKLVPTSLPSLGDSSPRDTIPYEALSYFWGLDPDNVSINIASLRDQSRFYNVVVEATKASAAKRRVDAPALSQLEVASVIQKKFWIRPNLHAALLQLRHPTEETKLWIDAICINQEDSVEKTAQVSRMHQIYSNAENVCIWLGVGIFDPVTNIVEPEATRRVYDFIRDMLDLQHLDQLVQEEKCGKDWLAFVQLMRNRWFSRRWVVQELALAREATVHYGKEVILWEDFADAVALFVTKHDQINALLKRSGSVDPIGDIRVLGGIVNLPPCLGQCQRVELLRQFSGPTSCEPRFSRNTLADANIRDSKYSGRSNS